MSDRTTKPIGDVFVPVPLSLNGKGLSPADKLAFGTVFYFARFHDGACRYSNKFLADYVEMSLSTFKRSLDKLEEAGLIRRDYRDDKMADRHKIVVTWSPSKPIGPANDVVQNEPPVGHGVVQNEPGGWVKLNHGVVQNEPGGGSNWTTLQSLPREKTEIPPPTPPRPTEAERAQPGGGEISPLGEMPVQTKPTPQPKADPGQRPNAAGEPSVVGDTKPEPKPATPSISEADQRTITEVVGQSGLDRVDEILALDKVDVEIAVAAARYVSSEIAKGHEVKSRFKLWKFKAEKFAADGVPAEFEDPEARRRRKEVDEAMNPVYLESCFASAGNGETPHPSYTTTRQESHHAKASEELYAC